MAHPPDNFSAAEVAVVLSQFDLGVIVNAEVFARGSARAPKMLLTAERGAFLLKRRAAGKNDPHVVAFSHGLQLHLAKKNFPLPHLVGTRGENNSMVQHEEALYELFEFIPGTSFDYSKEQTFQSGRTLALFHKLTKDYQADWRPPEGGNYHANPAIMPAFERLVGHLEDPAIAPPAERPAAQDHLKRLFQAYQTAAEKVNALGLPAWPIGLVHADFHPGNCLYHNQHVVAVLDFDGCRMQQRILDTANAALQFSIRLGAGDPRTWKVNLHATRLHAFITGYESLVLLTEAEIQALPWLMIESMTCEVILGIRNHGAMAGYNAPVWLAMLDAKVSWVLQHVEQLIKAIQLPADQQ